MSSVPIRSVMASLKTKKPAPNMLTIIGSTTVRAKREATVASKAFPPWASISTPAELARG